MRSRPGCIRPRARVTQAIGFAHDDRALRSSAALQAPQPPIVQLDGRSSPRVSPACRIVWPPAPDAPAAAANAISAAWAGMAWSAPWGRRRTLGVDPVACDARCSQCLADARIIGSGPADVVGVRRPASSACSTSEPSSAPCSPVQPARRSVGARAESRDAARTRWPASRCAARRWICPRAVAAEQHHPAAGSARSTRSGHADQRRDPDAARDEHDFRAPRRGPISTVKLPVGFVDDQRVSRPDLVVEVSRHEPVGMRLTVIPAAAGQRRARETSSTGGAVRRWPR